MISSFTLTLSLLVISFVGRSYAAELDVFITQYTGIKRSEIRPIEQRFYFFQFCACPSSVNPKNLPDSIEKCSCSNLEKGKQMLHSVPNAKFVSNKKQCSTGSCLRATIDEYDSSTLPKLFVKVSAGSQVLTKPEFQSITLKKSKNEVLLQTSFNSKMRMSYDVDVSQSSSKLQNRDSNPVKVQNSLWKNTILSDQNGGAADFFKNLSDQKKFVLKKEERETVTDSTISNVKIESDLKQMTTFPAIKNYLFSRSRVDRLEPSTYDTAKLQKSIIAYHNSYRAMHGSAPLTEDSNLHSRGKRWADELAFHRGCLVHEQPRIFGENLFFFGARYLPSVETLANAVVQSFYMEGVGYNYSSWRPLSYFKTGHFTQLVWRKSTKIGVGISIVKSSNMQSKCFSSSPNMYFIFVVVKYDPAGNFDTFQEYTSNVRPPL